MDTFVRFVALLIMALSAWAFFRNLGRRTEKTPKLPHISDDRGIVQWFLQHDKQLNGIRANFPNQLREVEEDIVGVLRTKVTASDLKKTVLNIMNGHDEFAPAAMDLYRRGGPYSDDEIQVLFFDELASTKLRILGYVLLQKHGIDPKELTASTQRPTTKSTKARRTKAK